MPKPLHEDKSEIISEYSLIVENTPEGFARGINNIFSNSDLKKKMIKKGLDTILIMEVLWKQKRRYYIKKLLKIMRLFRALSNPFYSVSFLLGNIFPNFS